MDAFNLKVLIVEDNFSFGLELKMLVEELNYTVLELVDNSGDALDWIYSSSPDFIIMDIDIKGKLSGLEIGQKIKHLKIPILYITSYSDQRTRDIAQSSQMAGFLVKPLEKKMLSEQIDNIISRSFNPQAEVLDHMTSGKDSFLFNEHYFFKKRQSFHKVSLTDILFIKSNDNYCETYVSDEQTFLSRITISKMEKLLPKDIFFRIHRQYIIQLKHIDSLDLKHYMLRIQGHDIPISRSKRKELEQMITKRMS